MSTGSNITPTTTQRTPCRRQVRNVTTNSLDIHIADQLRNFIKRSESKVRTINEDSLLVEDDSTQLPTAYNVFSPDVRSVRLKEINELLESPEHNSSFSKFKEGATRGNRRAATIAAMKPAPTGCILPTCF
eukprot:GHVR01062114.1.p1 GENE.GHVR01062114.1~~GHVR01062114.1.p1  ORF type:complete len:131 (+),score=23.41 GHVR01062114.1:76-468(+)